MSDSEDSIDENFEEAAKAKAEESVEYLSKTVAFDRKNVPKHLKQRYWNSWEEMHLIELWRQYFDEVTNLEHNLPIFCKIGAGLREYGYHMNAQEIRRKMKTIKNRYVQESRRLNEHGGESEWRLYRLMHCMMSPKQPNCDVLCMNKVLEAITKKHESEPLFHILASGMPVNETLKRIENGEKVEIPKPGPFEICFPIENKRVAARIICAYENKHKLSYTPRVFRHNDEQTLRDQQFERVLNSLSTKHVIKQNVVPSPVSPPLQTLPLPSSMHLTMFESDIAQQHLQQLNHQTTLFNGQGILKSKVNKTALERIRAENRALMEEVCIATKKLKQEENQLKGYELMMSEVKSFYQRILENM